MRLTQDHWSSSRLVGQLGQSLAIGKQGTVESRGPETVGDPEEIQQKREPSTRGAAPVCREARVGEVGRRVCERAKWCVPEGREGNLAASQELHSIRMWIMEEGTCRELLKEESLRPQSKAPQGDRTAKVCSKVSSPGKCGHSKDTRGQGHHGFQIKQRNPSEKDKDGDRKRT